MKRKTWVKALLLCGVIVFTGGEISNAPMEKNKEGISNKASFLPKSIKKVAGEATAHAATINLVHYRNKVLVLTYHNLAEKESAVTISPEKFHEQMQFLKENQYHVIPMEDFIQFLQGKKQVPDNAVVITFDDGYESFYKVAYPELKSDGFKATNFVIVHSVNTSFPWFSYLTWDEMKQMKQDGFSFYSHTYNLHEAVPGKYNQLVAPLASPIFLSDKNRVETEQEYEKRVKDDLSLADKTLQDHLGDQSLLLCFPHGAYKNEVINLAHDVGINYFFTGKWGINTNSSREIKRIDLGVSNMTMDKMEKILAQFNK